MNPELMEYSDDALAEMAVGMKAEGQKLLEMAGKAEWELVNRMEARGATHLDEEHWSGKLALGVMVHTIEDAHMLLLEELVTQEQWRKVRVQPKAPPPRWDQKELNELAKLGGRVGEIITGARTTERQRPKLTLERKKEKVDA
jgi:hypothetical protein